MKKSIKLASPYSDTFNYQLQYFADQSPHALLELITFIRKLVL